MNFFPLNFWFFTNTRAPKERFKLVFSSGKSDLAKIWPLKVWTPAISWKSSLYENFHQTKTRFRVRSLPGLRGKNGRQIRTQRGPLTPKPPSDFSAQTRVCGFLECTKVYCAVYNKEYNVLYCTKVYWGVSNGWRPWGLAGVESPDSFFGGWGWGLILIRLISTPRAPQIKRP